MKTIWYRKLNNFLLLSRRCCCGQSRQTHPTIPGIDAGSPGDVWFPNKHTRPHPTDAYGTIEFQGGAHPTKAQVNSINNSIDRYGMTRTNCYSVGNAFVTKLPVEFMQRLYNIGIELGSIEIDSFRLQTIIRFVVCHINNKIVFLPLQRNFHLAMFHSITLSLFFLLFFSRIVSLALSRSLFLFLCWVPYSKKKSNRKNNRLY